MKISDQMEQRDIMSKDVRAFLALRANTRGYPDAVVSFIDVGW